MSGLLELAYPPSCTACGEVLDGEAPFCDACRTDVHALPGEGCSVCSEPGRFPRGLCPRCTLRPPPFARAWAPFVHEGAIARAIHQFKYEDHPELAVPLGSLLASRAAEFLRAAQGELCAIPLHASRYRERRYDQAHLLAAALGRAAGRGTLERALLRVRATKRQVGLDESSREQNLAGAFVASGEVSGRALVLVDDVFTTGATARAAASALLEAGAAELRVLTLARAFTP